MTQLDYDSYVGRLAIGRIVNGTLKQRDELLLCGEENKKVKVNQALRGRTKKCRDD